MGVCLVSFAPEFSRLQFTQFVAGGTETLQAVIVGVGGGVDPDWIARFAKPALAPPATTANETQTPRRSVSFQRSLSSPGTLPELCGT